MPQPQTLRAVRVREGLAIPQQLWEALNLKLPPLPPRLIDGEQHVLLDSSLSWRIDEATQTLLLDPPPSAFRGQSLSMDAPPPRLTLPARLGLFANYDLQYQRSFYAAGSSTTDALLELGALSGFGDYNSQHLYRSDGALLRLESRWALDLPERMARLKIGDAISQPGAWGNAMRFGGLQWGSDFSLRPGFLSFPLPALRGEAALPSTLDVYVNNSQRLQGRVQAGAFDISELPLVTGQGEIRTVVRDLLGREQVMVQPYYVSPSLLKPGLHAYSIELGWLRRDYGLRSNHYGPALLSVTDRLGRSDNFTQELRAELQPEQQTVGATGIWLWPMLGTGNMALALSRDRERGRGWLLSLGLDRQAQDWSGSLQARRASQDFSQVGRTALSASWSIAASVGTVWRGTSLGLSLVRQGGSAATSSKLASLTLARSLGPWGYLSLFALRNMGDGPSTTVALGWSYTLDERSSLGMSLQRTRASADLGGDSQQLQLQYQQNPLYGRGLGYQLVREAGDQPRLVAQANWQGDQFGLNGGLAQLGQQRELRLGAVGGLAWLDGSPYLSRRIEGGFAVVQVGDYPDVGVLHDNQELTRTDRHGRAFIGTLRGYQPNRVSINPSDLPFDAELERIDLSLTPAARNAVLIEFPVRRSRAASFRLVDARGAAVPAGSELRVQGQERRFPVGLDGRAFVSGLGEHNVLRVSWPDGRRCSLPLVLPRGGDELPELGTLRCLESP